MKHHESSNELQEKAMLYAIGALPEEERRDYARHLEEDGCAVCISENLEFQNAAQSLAMGLPSNTPSGAVKERLMAQVRAEAGTNVFRVAAPSRNFWYWAEKLVLAAAVVLLAITATINSGLRRDVGTLTSRLVELEDRVRRDGVTLATLTSPEVRVVNLAGQGVTPQARARIFWNETDRVWLLYVTGLPPVPQDRDYQLWFVPQRGNPQSVRVFNTNADGSAMLEIPVPAGATDFMAAAVTTEPAGGLPQPSGAFVLLGAD
jgi:anti-sigma-K factor RskA